MFGYGPEHDLATAETTCAGGQAGETKSINATDDYADHDGIYLRIKDVSGGGVGKLQQAITRADDSE